MRWLFLLALLLPALAHAHAGHTSSESSAAEGYAFWSSEERNAYASAPLPCPAGSSPCGCRSMAARTSVDGVVAIAAARLLLRVDESADAAITALQAPAPATTPLPAALPRAPPQHT